MAEDCGGLRRTAEGCGGLRRVAESNLFVYYINSIAIPQVFATLRSSPQLLNLVVIAENEKVADNGGELRRLAETCGERFPHIFASLHSVS